MDACVSVHVVAVIKKTWESDVKHIVYFSDVDDDSVPTVTLGVANTERGSFTVDTLCFLNTLCFIAKCGSTFVIITLGKLV